MTLILISSYKEYTVNIMRKERNWEAQFANITYKEALEIAKDNNIKEISVMHSIGDSEEIMDFFRSSY